MTAAYAAHAPAARIHKLTRRLADARQRASMARATGDDAGAAYALAEARRLRAILAEG